MRDILNSATSAELEGPLCLSAQLQLQELQLLGTSPSCPLRMALPGLHVHRCMHGAGREPGEVALHERSREGASACGVVPGARC